jgi:hypothetical protein
MSIRRGQPASGPLGQRVTPALLLLFLLLLGDLLGVGHAFLDRHVDCLLDVLLRSAAETAKAQERNGYRCLRDEPGF